MLHDTGKTTVESRAPSGKSDTVARPRTLPDLLRLLGLNRQGQNAKLTIWLGPDLARDLLGKNHPQNRAVSGAHLRNLVREHDAGRFLYTPHPIVIDGTGTLGDGQHRCTMVAQTGAPILTDISQMFNQDEFERARLVIDTGRTRTRGHVLEIGGFVDAPKGALANGILSRIGYFHSGIESTRSNMEQVETFRPWANSIRKALALRSRWNIAMRAAAAVAYKHNSSAAEELFRQFESNTNLKTGMPAHAMVQMQTWFATGRGRTHDEEVMMFIFKVAHKQMTLSPMRSSAKSTLGYSTRPSPMALEYFFGSNLRPEWRERCDRLRAHRSAE